MKTYATKSAVCPAKVEPPPPPKTFKEQAREAVVGSVFKSAFHMYLKCTSQRVVNIHTGDIFDIDNGSWSPHGAFVALPNCAFIEDTTK